MDTAKIYRSFLAFPLPSKARDALRDWQEGARTGLRWTPWENFHLTLLFFGQRDAQWLAEALVVLQSVQPAPSPTLTLKGFTVLQDALVALAIQSDEVERSQRLYAIAFRRSGLYDAPPTFLPHVTVARIVTAQQPQLAKLPMLSLRCTLDPPRLYTSQQSPTGTRYLPWTLP